MTQADKRDSDAVRKNFPSKEGISVVIPCLNESQTLSRVIATAMAGITSTGMDGEVIVADNGSTDGSQQLATDLRARVINIPERGYGAALHGGIMAAQFDWVVFADADLSYPFEEIPRLIAPLKRGEAEIVLGSRLDGTIEPAAMPLLNRYVGTPILSFLVRRLYRIPTSDCNSGMRALLRARYEDLNLRCPGMEYASEMLIRAGQRRLAYREVPIRFQKDQRNRAPHLKRWRDGWRHLRFILGNASSASIVLVPLTLGVLLLLGSFALSLSPLWNPGSPVRYHSAFSFIAFSIPFLMFTLSSILVKSVLHDSGQVKSRLIEMIKRVTEDGKPFYVAAFFYFLVFLQTLYMLFEWKEVSWGELSDIGGVIRLTAFALIATWLFSLDLALGIMKLIPYSTQRSD